MARRARSDGLELSSLELYRARRSAARIASHRDPKIGAVGSALRAAIGGDVPHAATEALSAVERRRSALLGSADTIEVVDYGAGAPDSHRTEEEMERGVVVTQTVSKICKASKRGFWAMLLFQLVRYLEPRSCVELGTCFGMSGSYQAVALGLTGAGALVTLEGSPRIAEVAEETFDVLAISNARVVVGPFRDTLDTVMKQAEPVDFFFNDGHHDEAAVLRYLDQAAPHLARDAVVVVDDISWSAGMRRAWEQIERDERVRASVDLDTMGIAIVGPGRTGTDTYRVPIPIRSAAAHSTRR